MNIINATTINILIASFYKDGGNFLDWGSWGWSQYGWSLFG